MEIRVDSLADGDGVGLSAADRVNLAAAQIRRQGEPDVVGQKHRSRLPFANSRRLQTPTEREVELHEREPFVQECRLGIDLRLILARLRVEHFEVRRLPFVVAEDRELR